MNIPDFPINRLPGFMSGMPLGYTLMAHFPNIRVFFAVPVVSLLAGGSLAMMALFQPNDWAEFTASAKTINVARCQIPQPCVVATPPGPWTLNNY